MAVNQEQREFLSTYTSYSGSDLQITFGSKIIGSLQQISWAIQREKTPVFTCGSANPRSFSRGKRGIAGSLVLATFDEDSLMKEMKKIWDEIAPAAMYTPTGEALARKNIDLTNRYIAKLDQFNGNIVDANGNVINQSVFPSVVPAVVPNGFTTITADNLQYADQIPPFDVTLTLANEYGQTSFMKIYDLELLNEASGISVDSTVMEKNYTWIARSISPLHRGIYVGDSSMGNSTENN